MALALCNPAYRLGCNQHYCVKTQRIGEFLAQRKLDDSSEQEIKLNGKKPTMMELKDRYADRIDFVVLDVTKDETTARAAADARRLGLGKFFEANKQKTSSVVVLSPSRKVVFQTMQNFDRQAYVKAFNDALAKS